MKLKDTITTWVMGHIPLCICIGVVVFGLLVAIGKNH